MFSDGPAPSQLILGWSSTVCVLKLTPSELLSQPGIPGVPAPESEDPDSHIPGFPHFVSRAYTRALARSGAGEIARMRAALEWSSLLERLNSVELGSTCPTVWPDRRQGRRVHGLVLTDNHRDNARTLDAAARQCGTGYLAFRGWEEGPGQGTDLRLVCQTHCGTRACERCDGAIRLWQQDRVAGPWALFLTLTIPPGPYTLREAWEGVHEALRVFWRELRRECAKRVPRRRARGRPNKSPRLAASARARGRIRGPAKLHYAWTLEAHQSGMPHVHLVINQTWLAFAWVRELWARCVGAQDANVDGRRVTSQDGVSRYLSKYISKGGLSLDILAIIKGRRAWACTLKSRDSREPFWVRESATSPTKAEFEIGDRDSWGVGEGWRLASGRDGCYAIWKRPAVGVVVEALGPLDGSRELDGGFTRGDNDERTVSDLVDFRILMSIKMITSLAEQEHARWRYVACWTGTG